MEIEVQEFFEYVVQNYPYPIAYQMHIVLTQNDPKRKFDETLKLGEWICRYVTLLELIAYYNGAKRSKNIDLEIQKNLNCPALGTWISLGKSLLEYYDLTNPFWPSMINEYYRQSPEILTPERNLIAHYGVNPSDEQYKKKQIELMKTIEKLLNFSFFTRLQLQAGDRSCMGINAEISNITTSNKLFLCIVNDIEKKACTHPFLIVKRQGYRFKTVEKTEMFELENPYFFLFNSFEGDKNPPYIKYTPVQTGLDIPFLLQDDEDVRLFREYVKVSLQLDCPLKKVWAGYGVQFSVSIQNQSQSMIKITSMSIAHSANLQIGLPKENAIIIPSRNKRIIAGSLLFKGSIPCMGWIAATNVVCEEDDEMIVAESDRVQFECLIAEPPALSIRYISKQPFNEGTIPVESPTNIDIVVDNNGGPAHKAQAKLIIQNKPDEANLKVDHKTNSPQVYGHEKNVKIASIQLNPIHTGNLKIVTKLEVTDQENKKISLEEQLNLLITREGVPMLVLLEKPQVKGLRRIGNEINLTFMFTFKNKGSAVAQIRDIKLGKPVGTQICDVKGKINKILPNEEAVVVFDVKGDIRRSAIWPQSRIEYADLDGKNIDVLRIDGFTLESYQHRPLIDSSIGRTEEIDILLKHIREPFVTSAVNTRLIILHGRPGIGKSSLAKAVLCKLEQVFITKVPVSDVKNQHESYAYTEFDCFSNPDFIDFLQIIIENWLRIPSMSSELWNNQKHLKIPGRIDRIIKDGPESGKSSREELGKLICDIVINKTITNKNLSDHLVARIAANAGKIRTRSWDVVFVKNIDKISEHFLFLFNIFLKNLPSSGYDIYLLTTLPDKRIERLKDDFAIITYFMSLSPLSSAKALVDQIQPFPRFCDQLRQYIAHRSMGIPGVVKNLCRILNSPDFTHITSDEQIYLLPQITTLILDQKIDISEQKQEDKEYINWGLTTIKRNEPSMLEPCKSILEILSIAGTWLFKSEIICFFKFTINATEGSDNFINDEVNKCLDILVSNIIVEEHGRANRYGLHSGLNRNAYNEVLFSGHENHKSQMICHIIDGLCEMNTSYDKQIKQRKTLLTNTEMSINHSISEEGLFHRYGRIIADCARYCFEDTVGRFSNDKIKLQFLINCADICLDYNDQLSANMLLDIAERSCHLFPREFHLIYFRLRLLSLQNTKVENQDGKWRAKIEELIRQMRREISSFRVSVPTKLLIGKSYALIGKMPEAIATFDKVAAKSLFPFFRIEKELRAEALLLKLAILKDIYAINSGRSEKVKMNIEKCTNIVNKLFLTLSSDERVKSIWVRKGLDAVDEIMSLGKVVSTSDKEKKDLLKIAKDLFVLIPEKITEPAVAVRRDYIKTHLYYESGSDLDKLLESIEMVDRLGDLELIFDIRYRLGETYFKQKEWASACQYFEESLLFIPLARYKSHIKDIRVKLGEAFYQLCLDESVSVKDKYNYAQAALKYRSEEIKTVEFSINDMVKRRIYSELAKLYAITGNYIKEFDCELEAYQLDKSPEKKRLIPIRIIFRAVEEFNQQNYDKSIQDFKRVLKETSIDPQWRRLCLRKLARTYMINRQRLFAIETYNSYIQLIFSGTYTDRFRSIILRGVFKRMTEAWKSEPHNLELVSVSLGLIEYIVDIPRAAQKLIMSDLTHTLTRKNLAGHAARARLLFTDALMKKGFTRQAVRLYVNHFREMLGFYSRGVGIESDEILLLLFRRLLASDIQESVLQTMTDNLRHICSKLRDFVLLFRVFKLMGDNYARKGKVDKAFLTYEKCRITARFNWKDNKKSVAFLIELAISYYQINKQDICYSILQDCLDKSVQFRLNEEINMLFTHLSDIKIPFISASNVIGLRKTDVKELSIVDILSKAIEHFMKVGMSFDVFHFLYDTSKYLIKYSGNSNLAFQINRYLYYNHYHIYNQMHGMGLELSWSQPYLGLGLLQRTLDYNEYMWEKNRSLEKAPVFYYNVLIELRHIISLHMDMQNYLSAFLLIRDKLVDKLKKICTDLIGYFGMHDLTLNLLPLVDLPEGTFYDMTSWLYRLLQVFQIPVDKNINSFLALPKILSGQAGERLRIIRDMLELIDTVTSVIFENIQYSNELLTLYTRVHNDTMQKMRQELALFEEEVVPLSGMWQRYMPLSRHMLEDALISIAPLRALDLLLSELQCLARETSPHADTFQLFEHKYDIELLTEIEKSIENQFSLNILPEQMKKTYFIICIKMAQAAMLINDSYRMQKWSQKGLQINPDNDYLLSLSDRCSTELMMFDTLSN